MGVRITTDDGVVALYDSVTGIAFGPVFDDKSLADDFLIFLDHGEKHHLGFAYGDDIIAVMTDARKYRTGELVKLVYIYQEALSAWDAYPYPPRALFEDWLEVTPIEGLVQIPN